MKKLNLALVFVCGINLVSSFALATEIVCKEQIQSEQDSQLKDRLSAISTDLGDAQLDKLIAVQDGLKNWIGGETILKGAHVSKHDALYYPGPAVAYAAYHSAYWLEEKRLALKGSSSTQAQQYQAAVQDEKNLIFDQTVINAELIRRQ
jgi:hypothetical protein